MSASQSSRSAQQEMIEVRRAFAEPIGAAETIAQAHRPTCEALQLEASGARRINFICLRVDNPAHAVRVDEPVPIEPLP
ncbi:hypothetical protein NKJ72_17315 [Mesorhizobium sp. M0045]|uniref:hypothetical protein n=1 Tax=Mesorhizobium sp. M0045 TaxID=2956857 RepID=UPI003339E44E